MNIVAWIVFGALAGWIASLIMSTDAKQGGIINIIVGIAGALIGGFIMQEIGVNGLTEFSLSSLLAAILGASLLLVIFKIAN